MRVTGDEAPLHLAAAIEGKRSLLATAVYDSRFFHCEYDGKLEKHQQKRADKRTYDHLVFYGGPCAGQLGDVFAGDVGGGGSQRRL